MSETVIHAMSPYWSEIFGNPSSIHASGMAARDAVEASRALCARVLGVQSHELTFTGSGTESCWIALNGLAKAASETGKTHIITSSVEHHAVLESIQALTQQQFSITLLPVTSEGRIRIEDLEQALRDETALVSIQYINNEIGTIQPIRKIGQLCRSKQVLFHVDACQAPGHVRVDIDHLQCDALSLNGSKIYGPKGIGLLYMRTGTPYEPVLFGGGQERGVRPGTIATPLVVGLATALEDAESMRTDEVERLTNLRASFLLRLSDIDGVHIYGSPTHSSDAIVSCSFDGVAGETLVLYLSEKGIDCATGAACTSESVDPSHVLLALGCTRESALGAVRFSFGRSTTEAHLHTLLTTLPDVLSLLRI